MGYKLKQIIEEIRRDLPPGSTKSLCEVRLALLLGKAVIEHAGDIPDHEILTQYAIEAGEKILGEPFLEEKEIPIYYKPHIEIHIKHKKNTGETFLWGERALFLPALFFAVFFKEKEEEVIEKWIEKILKMYEKISLPEKNIDKIFAGFQMIKRLGLGKLEWENPQGEITSFPLSIYLQENPIAIAYKKHIEESKNPICKHLEKFLQKLFEKTYQKPLLVKEKACQASTSSYCLFEIYEA